MTDAHQIDARGLLCPLPVLKLRKGLQSVPSGAVVHLIATDPMAAVDVPHFCAETGHELVARQNAEEATIYHIRKA